MRSIEETKLDGIPALNSELVCSIRLTFALVIGALLMVAGDGTETVVSGGVSGVSEGGEGVTSSLPDDDLSGYVIRSTNDSYWSMAELGHLDRYKDDRKYDRCATNRQTSSLEVNSLRELHIRLNSKVRDS